MQIELMVEGEGFTDIEVVVLEGGVPGLKLVEAVAEKGGYPVAEAFLFLEDGEEPIDVSGLVIDERLCGCVHHVHRAKDIEVTIAYKEHRKSKHFSPATRLQRVLDWATGPHGFDIDSAVAPEMELALHGETTALPKAAHIGRFVRHPHHHLSLDLIRGVVPNGGSL